MKKLFTLLTAILVAFTASAEEHLTATVEDLAARKFYEPLEINVSCFNRDVIAERVVTIEDCSYPTITNEVVTSYYVTNAQLASSQAMYNAQPISYSFATESVVGTITGPTFAYSGFPNNGHVECITDSIPGLYWQLAPYNGPNALCVRKGITLTGKFTFKNVGCYQHLYFLVAATGSGVVKDKRYMGAIAYYSDGTNDTTRFDFYDHADVAKNEAYYNRYAACHDNFGNYSLVAESATGFCSFTFKNNRKNSDNTTTQVDTTHRFNYYNRSCYAVVCEMPIDQHKLLDSVKFTGAGDDKCGLVIFAVTGKVAEIPAPDANPADPSRAPLRASAITQNSVAVEWDPVAGAQSYRIDVATDEDFHHMVEGFNNEAVIKNPDTIIDGLSADQEYYWRVRAVDSEGGQSASSAPRRVRTESAEGPKQTREDDHNLRTNDITPFLNTTINLTINRTLYKDGYLNTLCLPFSLTAEEIAVSPLTGCQLFEFESAEKIGNAQLDIRMTPTDHIEAGKPYLIQWANTGEVMYSLEFKGVTITTDEGQTIGAEDEVQFVGNINTTGTAGMENGNENHLFVGAYNTLYWPNTDNGLKGFRAHFEVPTSGVLSVPRNTPARIVMQRNLPTDISKTVIVKEGEKLLRDGRLIIIRNGVEYNAIGQRIK